MTVFGTDQRGMFRSVGVDTKDGQGILITVGGGGDPVGSASLVTSFSAEQGENYSISQCLNGGIYLYSFGHDPQRSHFSVGVTSFLRSCDGDVGADFENALAVYRAGRVSASKAISTLSIGNGALSGYLIGQNVQAVDNELGMINTTYQFIALKPQGS